MTNRIRSALNLVVTAKFFLALSMVLSASAHATWSIVAVDPDSGEAGLAAATCGLGVNFIADAVPGAGVVAAQAATSFKGRDQAREWIEAGVDAKEILARLSNPSFYDGWFDTEFSDLQYGVATLSGVSKAGHTGGDNLIQWSGGVTGTNFSVQGNTLRGEDVVTAAARAYAERDDGACRLTIGERLLRALEAGRDAGGDNRCPVEKPAQSAILLVVTTPKIDDQDSANTLRIVAPKEIGLLRGIYHSIIPYEPDENAREPVKHLREKYEAMGGRHCRLRVN